MICRFDLTFFSDGYVCYMASKKIARCKHGNSKAAVRNSAEMEGRPNQASGGDSSNIAHAIIVWCLKTVALVDFRTRGSYNYMGSIPLPEIIHEDIGPKMQV